MGKKQSTVTKETLLRCTKGHDLKYETSLDNRYKSNIYWCDECRKENKVDKGVWHCEKNCNYDICIKCRSKETTVEGVTTDQFMNMNFEEEGSLYKCSSDHTLTCEKNTNTPCNLCGREDEKRTLKENVWQCRTCNFKVCQVCRPILTQSKFGLYSQGKEESQECILQSLDTEVIIYNSVARVNLTQVYCNTRDKTIETDYYFPINDLGVFESFTAKYQDRVVKGVIKEKEKAKKEYKKGIKQGHMMGYAEIKEKTPDIMQVKLGNLPAGETVTIILSYIQKLEISQNKFWKFQLLGTLTPRFSNGTKKSPLSEPIFTQPSYWNELNFLENNEEVVKEPAKFVPFNNKDEEMRQEVGKEPAKKYVPFGSEIQEIQDSGEQVQYDVIKEPAKQFIPFGSEKQEIQITDEQIQAQNHQAEKQARKQKEPAKFVPFGSEIQEVQDSGEQVNAVIKEPVKVPFGSERQEIQNSDEQIQAKKQAVVKEPAKFVPFGSERQEVGSNEQKSLQKQVISIKEEEKEEELVIHQVHSKKSDRTWTISLTVNTNSPLFKIFSPSHELDQYKESQFKQLVTLTQSKVHKPNQDFVLLFTTDEIWQPQYVLSRSKITNKHCAMISFIPRFNQETLDDAVLCSLRSNDFDADMDAAQGEFIFILDRSGSMSGSRMKMANEALVLFLKSLPSQCYFNIVSFGNRFEPLYQKSQVASQRNIEKTVKRVEGFKANMGGTEMNDALNFTYGSPPISHVPRLIFLLTDGDVDNPDSVISLARINSKHCRTFTIGVGNGASPYLVRSIAEHGRGKHELIVNPKQLQDKMVYLLQASISPVLDNFLFEFDEKMVEFMIPGPQTKINVLKNEPIHLFVFLKEKFVQQKSTNIVMKYHDSILNKQQKFDIKVVNTDAQEQADDIQKLGIASIIKELESSLLDKTNPDIYKAVKYDKEKEVLDLSLQYQVLSKKTAFVCKIKENVVKEGEQLEKIIVPSLVSQDYDSKRSDEIQQSIEAINQMMLQNQLDMMKYQTKSLDQMAPLSRSSKVFDSKSMSLSKGTSFFSKIGSLFKGKTKRKKFAKQKKKEKKNKSKPRKKEVKEEDKLMEIIKRQNQTGYWSFNKEMLSLLKISVKNFKKYLPKCIKDLNISKEEKLNVWTTLIILVWIIHFHQVKKNSWKLIYKKSQKWLKNFKIDQQEVQKGAQVLLKIQ